MFSSNRFCLLAFLFLFFASLSVTANPSIIQKSPLDKRDYGYVQLANGLKVVVVSDKNAKNAAAALVVHAGSFDEPSEHLGLAHYLEHMLFLGTKKFPQPDEFKHFVSQYGGEYNATTKGEQTSFFFHIHPEFFDSALEHFSDFFIAPLFNAELMDRELNSVDAEFQMNINQGSYALQEVMRKTSNYAHPYSRFSAGNLKTLNNKEKLYPAVKAFFKKYYLANNMTLTLVGPQSKAELEALAQRYFAPIASGKIPQRKRPMVYEAEHLGLDIQIRSNEAKEMLIQFYMPSQQKLHKEKSGQLIAMLLGYEGKGALATNLKEKGWITGLTSQYDTLTLEQDVLTLHCGLTDQGANHVDDITQMLFSYIQLIKSQGVPAHFFNEIKTMSKLSFQYAISDEPITYAQNLAEILLNVPTQDLLTSDYYFLNTSSFPKNEVDDLLSQLQPESMRRTLLTPTVKTEHVTKWYQASYSKKKLTPKQLKRFATPTVQSDFDLPKPNAYLPQKLTLGEQAPSILTKPQKLEMDGVSLWFHQNTAYNVPRSNVVVNVELKKPFATPKNALLTELYVQLIENKLQDKLYAVSLAGGEVSFSAHPRGISLQLSSYSDKQQYVLSEFLQTMSKMSVTESEFKKLMHQYALSLQSYQQQTLYQQALADLNTMLFVPNWHPEELLIASKQISFKDFQQFCKAFWQSEKLEMLVHGNVDKKAAIELVETIKPYFPHRKQTSSQATPVKVVKLDNHKTWYRPIATVDDNEVLVWYLQHPKTDYATMAKMVLLSKLLESPYFQTMRIEKQLAYALEVSPHISNKVSGLVFWIQSSNSTPERLQQEIKKFINEYRQSMQQMPNEHIELFKNGLLAQLRQSPQTLDDETQQWWSPIVRGDYEFDRSKLIAQEVEKITLNEMIAFADELFKSQGAGQLMIISSTKKPIPKDQLVISMSALKNKSLLM